MVFLRQRGKGDATSHYEAPWLRLAAAVGSVKWPSSRRPSPTTFVKVTNRFCQLYLFFMRQVSVAAATCIFCKNMSTYWTSHDFSKAYSKRSY